MKRNGDPSALNVYLLWSTAGEKTIDFSGVVRGRLRCVAGHSGTETNSDAAALLVSGEPMVCDPQQ